MRIETFCFFVQLASLFGIITATVPSPPLVWDVVGPFPAGTREANADPIESPLYGDDGIFSVPVDSKMSFWSELADGGLVNWTQIVADSQGNVNIPFDFIRWDTLITPLGAAGISFQGWARGNFTVDATQTFLVQVQGQREVYFDTRENSVFGDPYGGGYTWFPVTLEAGDHVVFVRLQGSQGTGFNCRFTGLESSLHPLPLSLLHTRNEMQGRVSAHGETVSLSTEFNCSLPIRPTSSADSCGLIALNDNLVTDLVNGSLVTPWISCVLVNVLTDVNALVSISVSSEYFELDSSALHVLYTRGRTSAPPCKHTTSRLRRSLAHSDRHASSIVIHNHESTSEDSAPLLNFAAGQPIPVTIPLKQVQLVPESLSSVTVTVSFTTSGGCETPFQHNITIYHRFWPAAYKFSFLDFDQSLHYAVVIPPSQPCDAEGATACSVLFSTHGAGVDADEITNPAWADAYQAQKQAWIVLPTNRRNFGFDWQNAGLQNAIFAYEAFVSTLPGVPDLLRIHYQVDPERILFGGHSMGGHGCWVLSTHFADMALASAPAAGWISMELYQPYVTRVGYQLAHASLRGLLESALAEYDAGLHMSNLLGIDVIARMGGNDTNVPPYHMRRMARLQNEQGGFAVVSEVPGQQHWWGGVVDDPTMQAFYDSHLYIPRPALPSKFTFTCANPRVCGSRGGIVMLQLHRPFQLARVLVNTNSSTAGQWVISTQNVRRFSFVTVSELPAPSSVLIDGSSFDLASLPAHYCQIERFSSWTVCSSDDWQTAERSPLTYGPFRTVWVSSIMIVYGTQGSSPETQFYRSQATWLAQAWYYQGRGLVTIVADVDFSGAATDEVENSSSSSASNILLLGGPSVNLMSKKWATSSSPQWPVFFSGTSFQIGPRIFDESCVGLLSLLPHPFSPATNVVGLVAGTDVCGLRRALALLPIKSGETVSDWLVAGPEVGWRGVGGLLAAGYWNNSWQFDDASSYLS